MSPHGSAGSAVAGPRSVDAARRPRRIALALAAAVPLAACAGVRRAGAGSPGTEQRDRAALARCALERPDGWSPTRDLRRLAGEWLLTLMGEGGRWADGVLELRAPAEEEAETRPASARGLPARLVGWARLDFAAVGAVVPGDPESRDPEAPGVGAYLFADSGPEGDASPLAVILRIGSEANRSDRQRFDGAHTTLRVRSVDGDRFGGTWSSAEGARDVGGAFCATRSRSVTPRGPEAPRGPEP